MPLVQSALHQLGKPVDAALVHAVQEEGRDCVVLDECVEHLCGVDVWAVIEGERDCAWHGAVVDYGSDGDEGEAGTVGSVDGDGAELVVWSADYACLGKSCGEKWEEKSEWMHACMNE